MNLSRPNAGTTLVETMAAILLFSLVVGTILDVSVQSMTMGKRSEYAYTAYNLAKNHLETLKSMPYSNLANAAETDTYIDATDTPNAEGPFIRSTTVTPNYDAHVDLIKVEVKVDYLWKGVRSNNVTRLTNVVFQYN